ncbi:MAG: hypothetical protein MI974_32955 [Chitinophagales bacterium]|nr:hypothetical protein [Chitinophagales bacterium]
MKRIIAYDFGENFIKKYFEWLIVELNNASLEMIASYSPFESAKLIEEKTYYVNLQESLKKIFRKAFLKELNMNVNQIKDESDIENYEKLYSILPRSLPQELKKELQKDIEEIIINSCSKNVAFQLWLKGRINTYKFSDIKADLETENLSRHKNVFRLIKTDYERKEIIKILINKGNWSYLFDIVASYLKVSNGIISNFSLKEKLYNSEFWEDKIGEDIVEFIIDEIENIDNQKLEVQLFQEGYSNRYSKEFVYATLEHYTINELEKFIVDADEDFLVKVLKKRIELLQEVYDLCDTMKLGFQTLSPEAFQKLDEHSLKTLDSAIYFELWIEGLVKNLPKRHIMLLLDNNIEKYEEILTLINKGFVKSQVIEELMYEKLLSIEKVDDRKKFYTILNLIQKLISFNSSWTDRISKNDNGVFNLILWFLEKRQDFDFDLLKSKFIYFKPDSQVVIFKRLFLLKAKDLFELDIEKLKEIKRASIDIYSLNKKLNPDIPLDLTTDLIIESLDSYDKNGKFLVETQLLSIVLRNLYGDKKRQFRIENYFEKCKGRLEADYNWSNQMGTIKKIPFGEGKFYFKIKFEYNERLVEEVRRLPGRKWNENQLFWGVPSRSEEEVLEFARRNRFFLDIEGSNYANNTHFAEFMRKNQPNGITFCEGRVANKDHNTLKKKFWWCANQPCFGNCEAIHETEEWRDYTLLDFCKILGFNVDENSKYGFFPNGIYYQYISKVNRFNRLLERLYCNSCEHILYPVESSNYAAYTTVRFSCQNDKCNERGKMVYLNHCLNGICNSIIDSRVSKTCKYYDHPDFSGLYICDSCGSCCSDNMLSRRLENLKLTGGVIHPELKIKVEEKLGHLERAEYSCYKCGESMMEYSSDKFRCDSCNVEYNLDKFRLKHPHKHLRRNDYPRANKDE